MNHRLFHAIAAACVHSLLCWLPSLALGAPSAQPSIASLVREAAQRELSYLGDVRIEVQTINPNASLDAAPCARPEVQTTRGARLWGRSAAMLRCPGQGAWSLRVPVNVRVWGNALVATRPLMASRPIEAADLREATVELTQEPQGVVTDFAQLAGQAPTRIIRTGQPIALIALRAQPVVSQGDPVKVMGRGKGFSVATEGVALNTAAQGQSVRVRTPSGRILTGIAQGGRIVEVRL